RSRRGSGNLARPAGRRGGPVDRAPHDAELKAGVEGLAAPRLAAALATTQKQGRAEAVGRVFDEVVQGLGVDDTKRGAVREAFEGVEKAEGRRLIVEKNLRVDGRKANENRPPSIHVAHPATAPG